MSSRLGPVLVTGGAGFIGCALSQVLAGEAERWVVLDNLHPQVHPVAERPQALHQAAEFVRGDVTVAADLDAVMAEVRPETVIHLAAETGTAQSLDESTRHSLVNVVGTTQVLDALTRIGHVPDHIVLTSSRAVYGEGEWQRPDGTLFRPGLRTHAQLEAGRWDHEDAVAQPHSAGTTVPAPVNVYGATKLAQEHILSAWTGSRDTSLTALRLQNVYGPGQSLSNPYTGIVSLFSQLAMRGESIPLYEDGDITRDFVFIDDVVSAIATAVRNRPEGQRLVDVGSGEPSTIRQLAETIAAFHSAPAPHVTGQFRDGDVRAASSVLDQELVGLGWKPQWSLADGVAALQGWIRDELAAG
ncbi:NAD-dependent epimerase/dehydratase family protein [Nocardioides houyundeii]|uniref:NAD-dependent epimerase/dehydratase family protein n=1 Tax=Nocardioides houyundeii TaxID=2045452 RepID=UPI000C784332|nr:SDR family NAD(P)-dependent oxidoreductase [Nocardioides houyundeii]